MRRAGVLPNTFVAPQRDRLTAAINPPAAYSWIENTPLYLGENDVHGTCTCDAVYNAGAITDKRRGIVTKIDNTLPFSLYCKLGGMPADIGLDPAVVFQFWQQTAIGGYRLASIYSLALDDFAGQEQVIIDNGFVVLTATLDQAQLQQNDWAVFPGSPEDGNHMFLGTGVIGSRFTDATWGEECSFEKTWFAAQGLNAWRCELVPA